MGGEIILKVGA